MTLTCHKTRKMNLSFCGCGFNGIYHVGVAICFKEYAPHITLNKISGASAGSLAACALICDVPLSDATNNVLHMAVKARSRALGPFHPGFDINKIIYENLCLVLPENAHELCNGRLHVSVTRVSDGENVILSYFDSKEDLIQALLCSSFVPFYSGIFPPKFHGVAYMDGGFSNNLPILDENTITVSPFSGESDICPQDNTFNILQLNLANTSIAISPGNLYRFLRILFPPHPEVLSKMCQQGFDDALKFLQRNNLISCTRCLAVHSSIAVAESESLAENETENNENELEHEDDDCIDCRYRRQVALLDNLPEAVVKAIQDACDQVNKGVINWLFRHRPVKLLSFLAIPYILPVDITIVIFCKIWEMMPTVKKELQDSLQNMIGLAKTLVKRFNNNRHLYSAKFSCQLAITEYDYTEQNVSSPYLSSMIETAPSHFFSADIQASQTQKNVQRPKSIESAVQDTTSHRYKRKSYAGEVDRPYRVPQRRMSMVEFRSPERVVKNMKFGFTVDLSPHVSNDRNKNSRQDVVEALQTLHENNAEECTTDRIIDITNKALNWERECITQCHTDIETENAETFEKILDVTSSNEALLAFCYTDEQQKLNVTEIFNVTDADTSAVLSKEEVELNSNLQWDSDWNGDLTGDASYYSPISLRGSFLDGSEESFLSHCDSEMQFETIDYDAEDSEVKVFQGEKFLENNDSLEIQSDVEDSSLTLLPPLQRKTSFVIIDN